MAYLNIHVVNSTTHIMGAVFLTEQSFELSHFNPIEKKGKRYFITLQYA